MAASFWMRSQMVQGRYMYLDCAQTKNVAENTSTIHWTLTVTGGSSSFYTTGPTQILIGGNLVYEAERVSYTTGQFPAAKGSVSGTTTVKHDDVTGEANVDVTIYTMIYNGVQETRTENWVLDPNPRFATLEAAPNFTDEEDPVITYSNPALSNAASLQACISLTGAKDDIAYRDIPKDATSYTFGLSDAERDVLRAATPNSNTMDVLFCVRTIIGGSTDYSVLRRTLTIKNPNPTINPTITDSNDATYALTGDRSKLIKYYSNAAVTIGAAAVKKATLTKQGVTCAGQSLTADGTINAVERGSFTFSATDSRKNTATKTITVPFVEYINLTCGIENNIPSADGTMTLTVTGKYFNGSFGAVDNALYAIFRYKENGGSWKDWMKFDTVTISGNEYAATKNLTGLDYQTIYTFQAWVSDQLYPNASPGVYSAEKSVIARPVFHWGEEDFAFHVPVSMDGNRVTGLAEPVSASDAVPLGYAQTAFAPSGNGYDGRFLPALSTNQDYDGKEFEALLENTLSGMGNLTAKQIRFCSYPHLSGSSYYGTLFKHNDNYAVLWGVSYNENIAIKTKVGGTWLDFVHYSPRSIANAVNNRMQMVKLWENASPTSAFSPQTLSLSLAGYTAVLIYFRNHISAGTYMDYETSAIAEVGKKYVHNTAGETGYEHTDRSFSVSTGGITFENCYFAGAGASSLTTSNRCLIPLRIYGIKGVT